MESNKISMPDVTGRKSIKTADIKAGDVLAFATVHNYRLRTGLMVVRSEHNDEFIWAVNLFKEDGREWTYDFISNLSDILFFEATQEETIYALRRALHYAESTNK